MAEILRVENLSVALQDGTEIVREVDFTLRAGEVFALVGE
ncbi:MAG TPA: ABC transporter ATP-binding protein, partial [Piscirickettsiaceae bacterium]|nr:ABC transporter ATP-binding protein [Piscirickettsiaceae bacterium]